jgi:S-adenosylmethionine:tRNA ribosyltransferase-isomerase
VLVSDFNFDLHEELIAQHPSAERGSSRMLVMDRATYGLRDDIFANLPQLLQPGDLLVLNDSRVLPARLFATRAIARTQHNSPQPSGPIEILLIEPVEDSAHPSQNLWRALVRPARKVHPGETLLFFQTGANSSGEPLLSAEVVATAAFGERTLRFAPVDDFHAALSHIGHMPLPPYIRRDQALQADSEEDRARYQTVYSRQPGSAAAPTAGLHFTPHILAALAARGVEVAALTLHVGLGTFQPVRVERVEDIRLHSERYTLPAATAEALNRALAEGRRIVAVGTTTTRTLEHIAKEATRLSAPSVTDSSSASCGRSLLAGVESSWVGSNTSQQPPLHLEPHSGSTSIFLAPGHRFRMVGGLLTNFHLPQSTLLMLVAAFAGDASATGAPQPALSLPKGHASEMWEGTSRSPVDHGRKAILAAYAHAIRHGYRFYSYGDCMLVL